jgi:ABC-2 type transport system ATP-binding protein
MEREATMRQTFPDALAASGAELGTPVIVARGLTKRFGRVTAVDGLDFEVKPGHVTGFLGPNGAGKSTTLRMVLGLVRPTSGTATVLGMPYASVDRPTRTIGAVLETQSFHPQRSGRNHLLTLTAASGIPDARADEVLEQVGLADVGARRAGRYSLGMRQRLGIAGALLGDPRVLILDEPANGLDPQGIRWLRDLLRAFAARGNAVLVSSHLLAEMAQMADDVIVIDHGRLVRQASVQELTAGSTAIRVRSARNGDLASALTEAGLTVTRGDAGLSVTGGSPERVGTIAFEADIPVFELAAQQTSLEDVFLKLTDPTQPEGEPSNEPTNEPTNEPENEEVAR